MTNENSILFPCIDNQNDGCRNMVSTLGAHCPDCAEFHASMAEAKTLLADESWKSPADSISVVDAALAPIVAGFEVVEVAPVVKTEQDKPDLDSVCYTMNAAEVDAQAALYEIAAVLAKYQDMLKQIDAALAPYEVH